MTIAQGGTLLPDRDYYVKDDERFVRIRAQYVDYLTSIFTLARRDRAPQRTRGPCSRSKRRSPVSSGRRSRPRDPSSTAKKFSLAALEREMPGFDWSRWARPQGIDRTGSVILAQPSFFKGFAALIETTPHVETVEGVAALTLADRVRALPHAARSRTRGSSSSAAC